METIERKDDRKVIEKRPDTVLVPRNKRLEKQWFRAMTGGKNLSPLASSSMTILKPYT